MKNTFENNVLTIYPEGKIDTANAENIAVAVCLVDDQTLADPDHVELTRYLAVTGMTEGEDGVWRADLTGYTMRVNGTPTAVAETRRPDGSFECQAYDDLKLALTKADFEALIAQDNPWFDYTADILWSFSDASSGPELHDVRMTVMDWVHPGQIRRNYPAQMFEMAAIRSFSWGFEDPDSDEASLIHIELVPYAAIEGEKCLTFRVSYTDSDFFDVFRVPLP